MSNVIDPAGEEITLFDASQSALKTIDNSRKEFAMGNAVEIQTPKQMAQVEHRAVMTPMEMISQAVNSKRKRGDAGTADEPSRALGGQPSP